MRWRSALASRFLLLQLPQLFILLAAELRLGYFPEQVEALRPATGSRGLIGHSVLVSGLWAFVSSAGFRSTDACIFMPRSVGYRAFCGQNESLCNVLEGQRQRQYSFS